MPQPPTTLACDLELLKTPPRRERELRRRYRRNFRQRFSKLLFSDVQIVTALQIDREVRTNLPGKRSSCIHKTKPAEPLRSGNIVHLASLSGRAMQTREEIFHE